MDVLLRLRVLIWALVLGLWALMLYQYLGEEQREGAEMRQIVNPYRSVDVAVGASPRIPPPEPRAPAVAFPVGPVPDVGVVSPTSGGDPTAIVRPPPDAIGPAPIGPALPRPVAAPRRRSAPPSRFREERAVDKSELKVPAGFVRASTPHFVVFAEGDPASERFLDLLESLQSNLMLELAPFSPWARDQRVVIFLFKNRETYRQVTGRPAWSGGASSVSKRRVYVYESDELPGILAHELTHIYYDGFFIGGATDPLWLSEGMATLVQVERGLAAPTWLKENLTRLRAGEGFELEKLTAARSTAGWTDDQVRLWYAQSYSLVRFMIRTQYRSSFYRFSTQLRDGRPLAESLYRAYGAPYSRLRALEIAWRHEISAAPTAKSSAEN